MASRPNEKDYETLKWLLFRLQTSEDWCRPYFERAKRHYRLYRFGSAVDEDDWPYVNRVRSRDILAFIEDSTALLVQTLFATMPFFSVVPRETDLMYQQYTGVDPVKIGDQLEKCLDYQISHEDTEFFEEIVDFFKGGTILGNSYMGVYPKFDRNGTYLRPLLKTTDFWDIIPIAGAKRVTKARGIFVRDFQALEEIQRLGEEGVYKNVDLLKSPATSESDPEKDWHRALLEEVGMTNYRTDEHDVEVLHYFSGGHVITLGDRKVVLRDSNGKERPYPYDMPIVQYKYMPVPLEFYAMGIPEVLEVLQEDKNLIRSARRDNIDLVIQKVIKARAGADINFDLLKFYAGAIWPLENLNDIEEMDMQDVTQSSYQEESMREHDMENALSLFGYARGMTPQHSEQPTTVMKLQQASLNRMDLAVKLAEFTTLQNIAARIIMLNRRYMDPRDYEAIVGGQDAGFFRLTEEDIRRFFYFKPMGSSITNIKEIRQAQISQALQTALAIPPELRMNNVTPYTLDLYQAEKELYDAVDVRNPDKLLIKMPTEQEAMQQMGMQQGGGGGQEFMPDMSQLAGLMQIPYGQGG